MTVTLEQIQTVLISRLREPMDAVDMNVLNVGTLNDDLVDPLTWALRMMEITLADPLSVTDSDLSTVTDDLISELLDLSEYRLLKTIVSYMSQTDERLGPHGKWASQYPTRLSERLIREEKRLQKAYGINAGSIEVGMLDVAQMAAQ